MTEYEEEEPPKGKLTMTEAFTRLKLIQHGLATIRANLHDNIQALDDDQDFQDSIVKLQRDSESRAKDLETEVKRLRIEVKTIKDLLGDGFDKKSLVDS